jgi:hypothetical protein
VTLLKSDEFHLAWYRGDIPNASTYLTYVLVPVWRNGFEGTLTFDRITAVGLPIPPVRATTQDLTSPRLMDDTQGSPHALEVQLIDQLRVKATRARNELPTVVPTLTFRRWSGLEIPAETRRKLLLLGGAVSAW